MYKKSSILLIFFLVISVFIPIYPENISKIKTAGNFYFKYIRSKKMKNLSKSEKIVKNLIKSYPNNLLFKMIHGRIYLQKASSSFWFWNKYKWAEKAITIQDNIIQKNPDNIFLLHLRAIGCLKLPDFFDRLKIAEKDLKKIINIIKDEEISFNTLYWKEYQHFHNNYTINYKSSPVIIEKEFLQKSYYHLAVVYNRLENKKQFLNYLNKTINYNSKTKWAIYARDLYQIRNKKLYLKK